MSTLVGSLKNNMEEVENFFWVVEKCRNSERSKKSIIKKIVYTDNGSFDTSG